MIPFVNHAFFEPQTAAPGLGRAGGPVRPIDQSTPSGLRNNVAVLIAGLVAFALLLNREGTWVPGGNEQIYFLYLFKAWHPHFLAGDWTITGEPTAGHAVFNFCFGWPTLWIPLAAYAWIGRFASWCVLFAGLMRLGSHWRIRPSLVAGGIFLWLVQRQSFVANEWIIGTFEAKCVGYVCLIWGLDLLLRGGLIAPAALIGASFSFHTAVGLWGGLAVGIAVLLSSPWRRTLVFAVVAAVFALPGVITSYQLIAGGHPITAEQARFIVLDEMPFHLDPLRFGAGKIAVMFAMLAFNVLQASGVSGRGATRADASGPSCSGATVADASGPLSLWERIRVRVISSVERRAPRRNHPDPLPEGEGTRLLIRFQLVLGAIFLLGISARLAGRYSLVQLFPFRVFAVLIMLLFFWHVAAAWEHRRERPFGRVAIALAALVLLALPSFVMRLQTLASYDAPRWRHPSDDFRTAARWVRDHVPAGQVVIAPPWRKDAYYFTEHPLIACWHAPRYNDMAGWRERIEALTGDVSHLDMEQNLAGDMDDTAEAHYRQLTLRQLASIRSRYGGDWIITDVAEPLPAAFATATFKVYQLPIATPPVR